MRILFSSLSLRAGASVRRSSVPALVSLLAACGGGGGTGGGTLPSLSTGPFHSASFKGFHGSPDTVRTNVGTLVSDGVSTLADAGSLENANGVISADPGGPVVTYFSPSAGVLSLYDASGEHFRGGLTPSGKTMGVAAVFPLPGSEAALTLALRKGSGMSVATLSGDYHLCYFGTAGGGHVGVVGTATFDGSGGLGLGTTLANTDGVITGPSFGVSTYGVAPDGELNLGPTFRGGAALSGDHAIAGGGVTEGSLNLSWVFLRQATTAAEDTVTGAYGIVGIGYGLADGKYYDVAGSVTIEGAGHCTLHLTINREGVLSALVSSSTYTVAPDGKLELTLGGSGDAYRGAISADGTLGMLGGGATSGSDPALFVLFRRG